jgi:hypothetical protein
LIQSARKYKIHYFLGRDFLIQESITFLFCASNLNNYDFGHCDWGLWSVCCVSARSVWANQKQPGIKLCQAQYMIGQVETQSIQFSFDYFQGCLVGHLSVYEIKL